MFVRVFIKNVVSTDAKRETTLVEELCFEDRHMFPCGSALKTHPLSKLSKSLKLSQLCAILTLKQ